MTEEHAAQREQIAAGLARHPRVALQQLATSEAETAHLRANLPFLLPFSDATYFGFLTVLDWDHRLPSRTVLLRVFAYYSETTFRAGEAEYRARLEQITARDRFPEFDVPDFAGLTADEAYEAEMEAGGQLQQLRLVSTWRRDIDLDDAHLAVLLARHSEDFQKLAGGSRRRPEYLGDLEAVSWTPPCESGYGAWTVDVWYLTELNTSVGKGRSFLVDLERELIVTVREFLVRSG
jgi:hypothetical protein